VVAKSIGTQNPYNMIRATLDGLQEEPRARVMVAQRRGKKVADILPKRDEAPAQAEAERRRSRRRRKETHGKDHRRQADRLPDPPPRIQRQTLIGLGLNKMHKTRELEDTPSSAA
jgi:hypothetical protein